jgi:hypothetical protein
LSASRSGVGTKRMASAILVVIVIALALVTYATYHPGANSSSATSSPTTSTSLSSHSSSTITSSTSTTLTSTSASTSTSTSSSETIFQVEPMVSDWEQAVNNGCCAGDYYANASAISWNGDVPAPGFSGETLAGTAEINSLFSASLQTARSSHPMLNIANLTVMALGGGVVNASFQAVLNGTSVAYGEFSATADVQQEWAPYQGNLVGWVIEFESWDFLASHVQYSEPVSQVGFELSELTTDMDYRDLADIAKFYVVPSMLTIYGNVSSASFGSEWGGIAGTYTGSQSIYAFYAATVAGMTPSPFLVTIANVTMSNEGGRGVSASFSIRFSGMFLSGPTNAVIDVRQQWTSHGSNGWHIQNEYWDFLNSSG